MKPLSRQRSLCFCTATLAVAALVFTSGACVAETAQEEMNEHHKHHMPAPGAAEIKRSQLEYSVPDVQVVREDGAKVSFREEMEDGRPILMNFIFTSCTAICPVLSHVFSQVQTKLGKDANKVHLVSISIDPESDTVPRLQEYAKKFNAGPAWNHYTGTTQASIEIQKAFDAYRGDKMNHAPLTLLRPAPGKSWIRLEGFATPAVVLKEVQAALPKS
jgi:protein SCO1/2